MIPKVNIHSIQDPIILGADSEYSLHLPNFDDNYKRD